MDAYDRFAPYYRAYTLHRASYLRGIENIIIARTGSAGSLLDVGAGDGIRSRRIAEALGATRVVLVEPSAGMRAQCSAGAEVWPCTASEISGASPPFALIVCLWNVFGHIHGAQARLVALLKLKKLLAPGASIFLDVNHRHNAAAYGWTRTLLRMTGDLLVRSEKRGEVLVSWHAGGQIIRTRSHVFTREEMKKLFRAAGLKVMRRWAVNYDTGAPCSTPFGGHLLYQLAAA